MKRIVLAIGIVLSSVLMTAQEVRDTVIVDDSWRYEGQWPEGEGVLYHQKSGLYIGSFKEAKPDGVCLFISSGGSQVYYGNFNEGKRSGYGILSRPGDFYYSGNFENGYPEGVGKLYYPDMSVYSGMFHLGKPSVETGNVFLFSDKEKFSSELPEFPEMQLTKVQKKFLKKPGRKGKSGKEPEVEAVFMGGEPDAFSMWVNSRLVYPSDAFDRDREGLVKVRFVITPEGELADPFVSGSSGIPSLDKEALRVVSLSPEWTPGTREGEPVSVTYTLPVYFKIMTKK